MPEKYPQIPSHPGQIKDRVTLAVIEPIREVVRRAFQGAQKGERVVTRDDLVTLGLVTKQELNKIKD